MRRTLLVVILASASAFAGTVSGSLRFSNTPLLRPEGASEPAVAVANDGTVAVTGLQWLFNPSFFGTHFWTGPFGATPTFQGLLDSGLRQPGKIVFGSGDADFDIGSNNTLHGTTLMFFINPTIRTAQIGVSAVICPNVTSASFTLQNCTRHFVDRTESDRDWITSDGPHVYLSYHDSGNSTLIHVQRSDNDGVAWHRVGDPIVGQDGITAGSTFNNIQGPIVADSVTHNVYDIFASGQTGFLKGRTSRQTMSSSHAAPMPESIGPPVSCFSSHLLRSSTMFSLHSRWIRRTATYMQLSPRDITFSSRCRAIRACTGRQPWWSMLRPRPPRYFPGLPHMQARWMLFIMRQPLPARMTRVRSGTCIWPKRRITAPASLRVWLATPRIIRA